MMGWMCLGWLVGILIVLNREEKIGGLIVTNVKVEDFRTMIDSCELYEVQYKKSLFTWWNGRMDSDCIFENLDSILINIDWKWKYNHLEVEYLPRTRSDHAPLLFYYEERMLRPYKPFRFQNFWTLHESFMDVIRRNWDS